MKVKDMKNQAFQDQMNGHHCWGCGTLNEHGLKIKSYWSGDEAVCTWSPSSYHAAGPKQALNGGIIATVIDCHCVGTAIAAAYRAEEREIGSSPSYWYVTGSLNVKYLRPTSISEEVVLRAKVKEMTEKKTILTCSLTSGGKECASAEVVAVRVPPTWSEKIDV
jgi:acyl-coenzyme A thioesterase PaaI-like protein